MRRTTRRAAGALALAASALAGTPASADDAVAIVGATVHTGTGEVLEGATVVVADGAIAAVGPDAAVPAGADRVDAAGRHVYPGLIDARTVLGLVEVASVGGTIDVGEVGAINPNLRAELAVNPDSELLPVARTGGVLLALTAARGGLISGTSALIRTDGWTWEDMTVRAPAMLHVRWPKMRIAPTAEDREERVEAREADLRALAEAFADARAYWKAQRAEGARPDEDVKWDALRDALDGRLPVAVAADDVLQIRAALAWAEREGLRLVLVGGDDAWRVADELAGRDVPVVLGRVHGLPRRAYEHVHTPYRNAARLHEAGVRIAFSTGASPFAAANVRNLRLHAAQAVAFGLPAEAAVHALTLGAAAICGVADRLGSLEVGKEATLFLADGDVLAARTTVERAWIAGREVSLRDRQRRLYERYRERPEPR